MDRKKKKSPLEEFVSEEVTPPVPFVEVQPDGRYYDSTTNTYYGVEAAADAQARGEIQGGPVKVEPEPEPERGKVTVGEIKARAVRPKSPEYLRYQEIMSMGGGPKAAAALNALEKRLGQTVPDVWPEEMPAEGPKEVRRGHIQRLLKPAPRR